MAALSRQEIEFGLPWSWTPSRLNRYLKLADSNAYVITENGNIIGFSVASLGDARAHLVLLAVNSKCRRRGLGSRLLGWQLTAAQTAGLTDITLELRENNRAAQCFYSKMGFTCIRTLPGYYGSENGLRMRLSPIKAPAAYLDQTNTTQ